MEPHGYPEIKPGEGVLLAEMDEEKLLRQLSKDIEGVPYIKGVSNHMGSRLMEDPEKVKIILSGAEEAGAFLLRQSDDSSNRWSPNRRVHWLEGNGANPLSRPPVGRRRCQTEAGAADRNIPFHRQSDRYWPPSFLDHQVPQRDDS